MGDVQDVPADVKALAEDAVRAMCDLHDYAGRPAWVRIVEEVIMQDRARMETGRGEALEEAAAKLNRDADLETERVEKKRIGSSGRASGLWAALKLRIAANEICAMKEADHG